MSIAADDIGTGPVGPISSGERYVIIDIVPGFALFGVLLSIMVLTAQFLALPGPMREALPTATLLHIYAILGVALMLFAARSDRVVLACAVGVAAVGSTIPVLDWVAESRGWAYPFFFRG